MVYQCDRLIFLVDLVYHLPIYFFRLFFVGDIDHNFFYGHYNQPVPTFLYPHDDATLVPVYFYLFPNRILIHKPPSLRLVIPHQVIMQSRLFIEVLVLQSKRLVRVLVNPLIFFRRPQAVYSLNHKRLPWMSLISLGMPNGS